MQCTELGVSWLHLLPAAPASAVSCTLRSVAVCQELPNCAPAYRWCLLIDSAFLSARSLKKQLAQQMATHHPDLLAAALSMSPELLLQVMSGTAGHGGTQQAAVPRCCCPADGLQCWCDMEFLPPMCPWLLGYLALQEWGQLGELAAGVVQLYDDGELTEAEVEERMSPAVTYFVSVGRRWAFLTSAGSW